MSGVATKKNVALVVDDSPETLNMINDALDKAGLTVLVALEGVQALTIMHNITPDIILLDALMPQMDGFETCRLIKINQKFTDIPIMFMTGLTDTESIVKGLESGGVDYITKPVNLNELVARMHVHLANARMTLSAKTALDSTGQYLFAVSSDGNLLWTTPQADQLFRMANVTPDWLWKNLPGKLLQMLSPHFNKEKGLPIEINEKKLEIRYIGQTGGDEFLLRLIDLDKPSETETLRSALPLTERESEVLLWISRGKTNREIGIILDMSPRTVNKHLEHLFRKINVENRTSAAIFALKYLPSN